jgi:alpha-tubulin suppressor-like RCC1 family protein
VAVSGLTSGVTAIAAGMYHSLAVKAGSVYAWGNNADGELGDGNTTNSNSPVQIDPTDLTNIVSVTANGESSFALSSDGSVWMWGALGPSVDFTTPQHLLAPNGFKYTSIDAGADGAHVVATLAAVPEPTSLSLLAFSMIAVSRRRRI